jgi:PD-(D/E)XK nuclease superfamily protein
MRNSVVMPRPGLPRAVDVTALREAVRTERSWRGVMRGLGFTGSRTGRVLREVCDELGIDYAHFRLVGPDDELIARVVPATRSWSEALERLGYARASGSARATVRKHCRRLGIETSHLLVPDVPDPTKTGTFSPRLGHLRAAGPYIVAAALTLAGHAVSWAPEGAAYDLLVDISSQGIRRVQVKTTTRRSAETWHCQLTRSAYKRDALGGHVRSCYSAEEVDLFACVDGNGVVYMLPIHLVEGKTSISLRKYAMYRLPLRLVGLTGFEPATPTPPVWCASQAAPQPVSIRD